MENPTPEAGASIQTEDNGIFETEPVQAEGEAPEETVAESPEGDAPEEDQGPQFSTDDLAQFFGLEDNPFDVDEEGQVVIKAKIDGKQSAAKFKDLLTSYQLKGHLDNETRNVAEQRKQLEARLSEIDQQAQQRLQQLEDLAGVAQQELMQEFNGIDWNALRGQDPAEYAARMADYQSRQGRINQLYQQVQQNRQQSQQEQQQKFQTFVAEQKSKLIERIPEWSDPKVAEKERGDLVKYAGESYGFSPEELGSVVDHRHVDILRKAMLWDQLQQSRPEVEKQVKRAPRIVRPGSKTAPKPAPKSIEDVFYS